MPQFCELFTAHGSVNCIERIASSVCMCEWLLVCLKKWKMKAYGSIVCVCVCVCACVNRVTIIRWGNEIYKQTLSLPWSIFTAITIILICNQMCVSMCVCVGLRLAANRCAWAQRDFFQNCLSYILFPFLSVSCSRSLCVCVCVWWSFSKVFFNTNIETRRYRHRCAEWMSEQVEWMNEWVSTCCYFIAVNAATACRGCYCCWLWLLPSPPSPPPPPSPLLLWPLLLLLLCVLNPLSCAVYINVYTIFCV